MWYDLSKILSYNKLFNYIVGEKGVGKTYAMQKYVLKRAIEKGESFLWLRRYRTELDTKVSFFNKLWEDKLLKGHDLKVTSKGEVKIDGFFAGKIAPLSKSNSLKGFGEFDKCTTIVFDEFIITNKMQRYISNEVTLFLDVYESVCRFNEGRAFFLGNSAQFVNPYFNYFGIYPDPNEIFVTKGDHVIEWCFNEEYRAKKKESRFGRLVEGTAYEQFAIMNDSLQDEDTFVEKRNVRADCIFGYVWKGRQWWVWVNYNAGRMWIEDTGASCHFYALTLEDHTLNTLMVAKMNRNVHFKMLKEAFLAGAVRFKSRVAKNDFGEYYRYIM